MSKIRVLRKAKGLTMKQLASRIGKTEACICQYEKEMREPPIKVARKIAKELGCEWEELYENDEKDGGLQDGAAS